MSESTLEIFYCPQGGSYKDAVASMQLRLAKNTDFRTALNAARHYFQEKDDDKVLRNEAGAIWPDGKTIVDEMARGGGLVRLAPEDKLDDDEEEDEVVEEAKEEEDDDNWREKPARPPKYHELFMHFIFLTILVVDTYIIPTEPTYHIHQALEDAFIYSRHESSDGIALSTTFVEATKRADFRGIRTTEQACDWLETRLPQALFDSDFSDAWGSTAVFNRLAGGLTLDGETQPWLDAENASLARQRYTPFGSGLSSRHRVWARLNPRTIEVDALSLNYSLIWRSDFDGLVRNFCDANVWGGVQDAAGDSGSGEGAAKGTGGAGAGGVAVEGVARSIQLSLLLHNRNFGKFFSASFRFEMLPSGLVRPFHAFRPFSLEPKLGSWPLRLGVTDVVLRLSFWLGVWNYVLVFSRTFNEIKACRFVTRKYGTAWAYFGGVFTILELFNLSCNYIGLGFRLYQMWCPERVQLEGLVRDDAAHTCLETDAAQPALCALGVERAVQTIVMTEEVIVTVRALSIVSAALLLFKYLELAPRRVMPAWHLTGTVITLAGRSLQATFFGLIAFLLTSSIIFEQLFGASIQAFSSVPSAFFALTKMVAGSAQIYRDLHEHFPIVGPLFFVLFTLIHLLVITPLFLATITDAYSVRDEQVRQANQRRRERRQKERFDREARKKQMRV